MLWVAVVVVGVAGVAVAAEWWIRERAVQRAVDRIAEALGADTELHVVGWPLSWHVLRRELPQVVVVAERLPVLDGRAHLDHLRIELDRVRLQGRGADRRVTAAAGRFHLTVTDDDLQAVVPLPPYLSSFAVVPTGLRLTTLAGVVVDATMRLEPEGLVVRPAGSMLRLLPQPAFRVPLPAWPYGATVEAFRLHGGAVEAWGSLDPATLVFPAHVRRHHATP